MLTGFTVHRSFYQNKIVLNHDVLDGRSCEILYYLYLLYHSLLKLSDKLSLCYLF